GMTENNKLISILLPTYNRGNKCIRTIQNVLQQTYPYFELIIINDGSDKINSDQIETYLQELKDERISYYKQNNQGISAALNFGLSQVKGEYVTWISDDNCLEAYFLEELLSTADFSYANYSLSNGNIITTNYKDVKDLINNFRGMVAFMWKKELINKIGSFNHSLSCYCEDYDYEIRTFLNTDKIKHINKSLIQISQDDDTLSNKNYAEMKKKHQIIKNFYNYILNNDKPIICHTESDYLEKDNIFYLPRNYRELVNNFPNKQIKTIFRYPKLLHLYWDGSPLSYLNYLTVLSFNHYHKNWQIIVHMPKNKTETMSWTSNEQKLRYNGRSYLDQLKTISNVTIQYIDFEQIGFYNEVSEVIKSDYFRYYILYEYGGIWSDFDIIYTDNIEEKMNFEEDTIIFKGGDKHDYKYFPIGFFLTMPKTEFFKYVLSQCKNYYNPTHYQCIGSEMLRSLFLNNDYLSKQPNIKVCSIEY